jgi:hypothetical protein
MWEGQTISFMSFLELGNMLLAIFAEKSHPMNDEVT